MLTSLEIIGFQKHRHTKLEFGPGVNVIIGTSRAGKTSIIRMIEWIAKNRPIGIDACITHGEKEVIGILGVDDKKVTRKKNNKENIYSIDEEIFAGFGTNVPEPVKQLLNLEEINIQGQFSSPYLIFDSPGEVARTLNKIVHLDVIDTSLSNVAGLKRQNDQDMRIQQNRLNELNELKATFPDLEGAEEFIVELENQQKEKESKEKTILALKSIQSNLATLRASLAKIKIPVGIEQRIDNLIQKQTELEQKSYTLNLLRDRQTVLVSLRTKSDELKKILSQDGWISELLTKNAMLSQKKKILSRFRSLNEQIRLARTKLTEKLTITLTEEKKFKGMLGKTCPLCDQPILT